MEQATNLFTKGLLMDTHPMVQGNDTLTDCLNGTLITMNGNEVILQNDMGNRRVDKAFLPPGYEPVGMKEYGGVIYVAAYNPVTNKSQIGSFPSPLKKLSSTDNLNLEGTFDFNSFFSNNNVELDSNLNINIIKSDSFIIPLSNNINLRAGDKFAVYSSELSGMKGNLTNYDNINLSGTKALSPKNKKYTLLLGVLNSLNEFVDITKTLCRWKEIEGTWTPVNYDEEKSDIFKFNDGYFISDNFESLFNTETISDEELIKERQKIAANTYSYKLVGPLYLKCILNHIENFNYNIYGTYDKSTSKATLWIEGFLTYNCPDGVNTLGNNSNENYETFSEGEPSDNFGFDLYSLSNNRVTKLIPTSYIKESCVYNPSTNTYTVKLVKKFTNISATSGNIFNYVIGVKANNDTEGIYLKGLSIKGSIDLSLLGSGELKINGWKFYNTYKKEENDGSSILTFSFNAYPEYGKSFDYLRFKFLEIPSNNSAFYYPSDYLPLYNGRQTIKFDWKENGFNPRKVYKVTVYYREVDNRTKVISSEQEIDEGRWFLTTELFNEFYEVSANTEDYCKVPNDETHSNFYDKMIVNIGKTSSITNNSIITSKKVEETSLLSLSENILYKYENTYNLNLKVDAKLTIYNEDLYPDYIRISSSDSFKINKVTVSKIGNTLTNMFFPGLSSYNYSDSSFKDLIPYICGSEVTLGNTTNTTEYKFKDNIKCLISITSNGKSIINGTLKYYDIYAGKGESIIGINNAFFNFKNFLKEGNSLPKPYEYGGVVVNFANIGSGLHYVDVVTKNGSNKTALPGSDNLPSNWYRIDLGAEDIGDIGYISKFSGRIFLYLNVGVENTNNAFLYIFSNDDWYSTKRGANLNGNPIWEEWRTPQKTRLWWKMPNGEWAVFKNLLEESSSHQNLTIAELIINALGKDIIYCMYDYYDGNSNIYTAINDYMYSDKYSIPVTIKITYLLDIMGLSNLAFLNRAISFGPYGQSAVPCGNLCFQRNSSLEFLSDDDYLDIELKSSNKFLDDIIKFDPSNISNVYIKTGQMIDSNGDKLNPNQIYFVNDQGKLERILNNPLYIDNVNKIDGKNRILYNKTNKGGLVEYNVLSAEGNSSSTLTRLVYDNINLVESI